MTRAESSRPETDLPLRRLGLLFALYFAQGLPFGLQVGTLPVYLREARYSLTVITLAGAVTLPWMLKLLWAPLVERYFIPGFGRRRSWIVPAQIALALCCAGAAFTQPDTALAPLLALLLAMNVFAATMDIAVDGLAVDTLATRHLGYGNIAQVVGYKAGIIVSGGVLLSHADTLTWRGVLGIMAAMIALLAVVSAWAREPAPDAPSPSRSVRQIFSLLWASLCTPAGRWIALFIATYKLGETAADALFRPYLVDVGFSKSDIGAWVGTHGMAGSIAGSIAGGILATRTSMLRAVGVAAAARVIPVFGEWWLTWSPPGAEAVIAVTVAEQFFGGALTTAMFAFMMSRVDRRIGATHYTAFATIEVLSKQLSGFLAGPLADYAGISLTFGLATLVSAAYLLLLIPLSRVLAGSRGEPGAAAGAQRH